MKASFVDLRKKSNEIIRALKRNESITILYRGKPQALMVPLAEARSVTRSAKEHPAFGMWRDREDLKDVAGHVRNLRKGRFDAL